MVDDKLRILAAIKEIWGDARDHRLRAAGTLRPSTPRISPPIRRPT